MTLRQLDTNVCVHVLRKSHPAVVARYAATPPDQLRLCPVVLGELYYGAHRSAAPAANLALLAAFHAPLALLPFDAAAAAEYGRLRAEVEAAGTPIGPNDTIIAAIALRHGAILVTHNTAEFGRVRGLTVEDWQVP